jgi:hypothetical protein
MTKNVQNQPLINNSCPAFSQAYVCLLDQMYVERLCLCLQRLMQFFKVQKIERNAFFSVRNTSCGLSVRCQWGVLLGHHHLDTLLDRTSAMQSMLVECAIRVNTHEHESVSFSRPVLQCTQPRSSGEQCWERFRNAADTKKS